jgi:plasmid stabilization system protein ParE
LTGYLLSADAEHDLREIAAFVAVDSPRAALKLVDDLDEAMELLAGMPRMGHVREEFASDDVRFWVVHSFVIVYRAEVTPIVIVRIVSGFRDLMEVLA